MSALSDFLTGIANAIRGKTGETGVIPASQFAEKIAAIQTGTELPELTDPATADDIVESKQAIDSEGNIVIGTIPEYNSGSQLSLPATSVSVDDGDLYVTGSVPSVWDLLLRGGTQIDMMMSSSASKIGNAETKDVVNGKTFTSSNGVCATGTLDIDKVSTQGGVSLPVTWADNTSGDHCGTLTNSLGTATASDIRSGKTATVDSGTITGTVSDVTAATPSITVDSNGLITATATQNSGFVSAGTQTATKQMSVIPTWTITPQTLPTFIMPGQYVTGKVTVTGDENLVAENIKSGVSIFGVSGSYEGAATKYSLDIVNQSSQNVFVTGPEGGIKCSAAQVTSAAQSIPVGGSFTIIYAGALNPDQWCGCLRLNRLTVGYDLTDPDDDLCTRTFVVTESASTDGLYVRIKD